MDQEAGNAASVVVIIGLQECGNCHKSSPFNPSAGWWTTKQQVSVRFTGSQVVTITVVVLDVAAYDLCWLQLCTSQKQYRI